MEEETITNPINYINDLEKEEKRDEKYEEFQEMKEENVGQAIVDLSIRFNKHVQKSKTDMCRIWWGFCLVLIFMIIVIILLA